MGCGKGKKIRRVSTKKEHKRSGRRRVSGQEQGAVGKAELRKKKTEERKNS